MRPFVVITLAIVIVLLIFRNADVFSGIIATVTDMFGKSFKAVTSADNFK